MKKAILISLMILSTYSLTGCSDLYSETISSFEDAVFSTEDATVSVDSTEEYVSIENLPVEKRKEKYRHMDIITFYYPEGTTKEVEVYYSTKSVGYDDISGTYYRYNISPFNVICCIDNNLVCYQEVEDYYKDSDTVIKAFSGTFEVRNVR